MTTALLNSDTQIYTHVNVYKTKVGNTFIHFYTDIIVKVVLGYIPQNWQFWDLNQSSLTPKYMLVPDRLSKYSLTLIQSVLRAFSIIDFL